MEMPRKLRAESGRGHVEQEASVLTIDNEMQIWHGFCHAETVTNRISGCDLPCRRVSGFHVGGKTALLGGAWSHNLPAHEPLWLWGDKAARLPDWNRFAAPQSCSRLAHA